MILIIDTEKLQKADLAISEYCYLFLTYNNIKDIAIGDDYVEMALESKGFIKISSEGVVLRKKALDLFEDEIPIKEDELSAFVDKYRALFPAGVKSGNRLVKGDKHGCQTKLKSFRSKYPEYSQEEILEATKTYIDICKKRNFDKMTSADYFIEKDRISQLASYCEDIRIRGKQAQVDKGEIGRTKRI